MNCSKLVNLDLQLLESILILSDDFWQSYAPWTSTIWLQCMLYSTTAWQQKYSVTLYSTTPWQQITLLGVMLFIMYIKIKKKNLEVRLHHWQWKFQILYLFAQKISGFLWSRGVTPSNKNHLTWTKFEQEIPVYAF